MRRGCWALGNDSRKYTPPTPKAWQHPMLPRLQVSAQSNASARLANGPRRGRCRSPTFAVYGGQLASSWACVTVTITTPNCVAATSTTLPAGSFAALIGPMTGSRVGRIMHRL